MREPGFEELADLWQDREEGDPEAFEALARRARRKGRILGYADLGFILLLVGGVILSIFMTPNPMTIGFAILLLAATLWLNWTRRRMRQMMGTLNTSDPVAFLESSITYAKANLRRVNLSCVLLPPLVAIAVAFKGSQHSQGGIANLPQGIVQWASSPRAWIALTVVLLIALSFVRSRRKLQNELSRLESFQLEYEEERRRDVGTG